MGWTADSTVVTADSTLYTADGGGGNNADTSAPYTRLITSEHNQKPQFMAMVQLVTGLIGDCNAGIQSIEPAFDLDGAAGSQLDILGVWIGQNRVIQNILIVGFFGFADNVDAATFGELGNPSIGGVWYEQGAPYSGSTILSDPDYLTILKARIVRNQSNGTLSAIENALQFIFGVNCSVADLGTLSLAITVTAPITPTDQALLTALDILPRPAGVAIGSITYTA